MNSWATQYAATISLVNTLGMIILTAVYVFFTIKIQRANMKVVEQNEIVRKENNMPVIIVYFEMTIFNMLDLHIKNIGKSPAKNILVKLVSLNDTSKVKYLDKAAFIDKEIALLAPEQYLRSSVGSLIELKNENGDYPKYRVSIIYKDLENNEYEQHYIIDANMYKGTTQAVVKNLHDLTKEVEKIESHIEKMTRL
ncbi:hypothetical protein [Paenibacillus sp. DRB1-1]|uniref:hypothetical protein n=1 Tax=Paenibacillus sp. DRB1-1 TaxID=3422309 RepID=UPI003F9C77D9